jgi:hypothetical protein
MDGVISLLDAEHTRIVKSLWRELDVCFGVRAIAVTPFAHISYQIADGYAIDRVEEALRSVSRSLRRFTILTSGLGLFTGEVPVLYVPVVKSPALAELHERIWEALDTAGSDVSPLYSPDHWMPHITLAHGDLDATNLPAIIEMLSERNFTWEIAIDNLALIYRVGGVRGLHSRYPLLPAV